MAAFHTTGDQWVPLVKLAASLSGRDEKEYSVINEDASKAGELKLPFLSNGNSKAHGIVDILHQIVGKESALLGATAEQKEVDSWIQNLLPLLSDEKKFNAALHKQNKALLSNVFIVNNHFTLADLVLYVVIHPLLAHWNDKERYIFMNITRWFDNVQHLPQVAKAAALPLIKIDTEAPAEQPKEKATGKPEAKDVKPADDKKTGESSKTEQPAKGKGKGPATEQAADANANANANKEKPQQQKGQPGKGKGAAPAKEAAPVLSAVEDVSRFDIRVGRIVTCKKHEAADSLYVEQIEVGEPEPRQVVSGLVKFIPLEEMQGRRVVILANLKASNLKGVKSQAMVLCASNEDHTKVELVEPPEGAKPGERVTFMDFPGDPEKALKKETLDKVLPELKTNGDLVATYRGVPFMTSAGPCIVKSIANGGIK